MKRIVPRALLVLVATAVWCGASLAGLDEGIEAIVKGDYVTALKQLRPLAERGNAEAQYRLGRMYEFGRGVAVDMAQALMWLRKSAAQGNASAQQELGVIYATGDGVTQDDAQAVAWFEQAAAQGNATAQYNLALMYAKGRGVPLDIGQAIVWFRKAADQGDVGAQFKLGVAYENGEGVAKNDVFAYASYAIAAREGNADFAARRDGIARKLKPPQLRQARALAAEWTPGKPMPGGSAGAKGPSVATATTIVPGPDKCSATGVMEGEKFAATHCAVALYGEQHSVAIWFNEDSITPDEAAQFQISAYADGTNGGKQRTLAVIMFCPGDGKATASPAAVKAIDVNTNHARAPLAGLQRVAEAPKDFRVERLTGEITPGHRLAGKIVGGLSKTTWTFEFDVMLPAKDAAAGMSCGK